jgi:hypothetical protein
LRSELKLNHDPETAINLKENCSFLRGYYPFEFGNVLQPQLGVASVVSAFLWGGGSEAAVSARLRIPAFYLSFRFFSRKAVALLNLADQLILLFRDYFEVGIGEFTPFFPDRSP